ncbi:hypothetical protein [Microbacterium lacus]|uniref:HNH endonuclease n=1 Tax=Microbacterium lacus TaxID=415217 RepID=A0ABP4RUV8_9MICO
MPTTYRVRELRGYDRNVMRGARRSSDRVLETVPFCWMCRATAGDRTREHVFALRLQREFPPEMTRFEPVRYTSIGNGAQVGSRRGPFAGNALVAGGVCATCNNGWMSQLETDARTYLLGHKSVIDGADAAMLSRWFAKTAIIINVSQPYRLLWHDTRRHQTQFRTPDNVAISLYRTREPDLNWKQGSIMSMHTMSSRMNPSQVSRLTGALTHLCEIQVGTLVGAVVALPWQLSASALTMPGSLLWSSRTARRVDLSALPMMEDPFADDPIIDVAPSAFWSGESMGSSQKPPREVAAPTQVG